jgi:polyphosphate kinase 2 (PPK2 family)
LQRSVREEGRRIVILFEGRDAAGKGGSIKRFMENLNPRGGREVARSDPLRRWKLSPIDEASLGHFDDYTEARNAMFFYTDTPESPWTVVNSNEKKRARLESIRTVLHSLDYDHKDDAVAHAPDPKVVRPAATLDIPEDDDPLAHGGGPAAS